MILLGREDELRRVCDLIADNPRVVVTGLPGTGRHTLVAAAASAVPAHHELLVADSPRPHEHEEVVFRLGPLAPDAALSLFRRALFAVDADAQVDDHTAAALVREVDCFPLGVELVARLYASRADESLELIRDAALWNLLPQDPRAKGWRDALQHVFGSLPEGVETSLRDLSRFRWRFDAPAARHVCGDVADAALDVLVEVGLVSREGESFQIVHFARWGATGTTAGAEVDTQCVDERYVDAVLDMASTSPRAHWIQRDLRAIFHGSMSARARTAGARLVPFLVERVEPHLQRLLAIDDALASMDLETECAIARMHVALGEPEVAWRRLELSAPVAAGHRLEGLRLHVAANALRRMGRAAAAREHYQRAVAVMEEAARGSELGAALGDLGGFHHEQGDQPAARDAWTRALRYVARDGDAHAEAIAVGNLALVDHESEALEEAERRYRRALSLHRATGNTRFEGIVAGDLGELLLASGRPLDARRQLERSVEALERVGDDRQWVLISAVLSFAESVSGDPETGRSRIEAVRERAADDLAPVVALYAGAHVLHEARLARDSGERAREREILSQLEADVEASGDTPDEMRRAALVIRAELTRHRDASGWVFAKDARFFVSPARGRVELGRRKILRHILAALLEARLDPDAAPLTQSALLRAGWPGQRAESASARNRLHVSLSTLRKLGLDPLLRGDSAGYFLDPDITIDFPTGE